MPRKPVMIVLAVVSLSLALMAHAGAARLSAQGGPEVDRPVQTTDVEAEAVHGGIKPRFHGTGEEPCPLPGAAALSGNWTHGDYVNAWAGWLAQATEAQVAAGAVSSVAEAAHSPCGKPDRGPLAAGLRGSSALAPGHGGTPPGRDRRP